MRRRTLLAAIAGAASTGLAGCGGVGDVGGRPTYGVPAGDSAPTDDATPGRTATATATDAATTFEVPPAVADTRRSVAAGDRRFVVGATRRGGVPEGGRLSLGLVVPDRGPVRLVLAVTNVADRERRFRFPRGALAGARDRAATADGLDAAAGTDAGPDPANEGAVGGRGRRDDGVADGAVGMVLVPGGRGGGLPPAVVERAGDGDADGDADGDGDADESAVCWRARTGIAYGPEGSGATPGEDGTPTGTDRAKGTDRTATTRETPAGRTVTTGAVTPGAGPVDARPTPLPPGESVVGEYALVRPPAAAAPDCFPRRAVYRVGGSSTAFAVTVSAWAPAAAAPGRSLFVGDRRGRVPPVGTADDTVWYHRAGARDAPVYLRPGRERLRLDGDPTVALRLENFSTSTAPVAPGWDLYRWADGWHRIPTGGPASTPDVAGASTPGAAASGPEGRPSPPSTDPPDGNRSATPVDGNRSANPGPERTSAGSGPRSTATPPDARLSLPPGGATGLALTLSGPGPAPGAGAGNPGGAPDPKGRATPPADAGRRRAAVGHLGGGLYAVRLGRTPFPLRASGPVVAGPGVGPDGGDLAATYAALLSLVGPPATLSAPEGVAELARGDGTLTLVLGDRALFDADADDAPALVVGRLDAGGGPGPGTDTDDDGGPDGTDDGDGGRGTDGGDDARPSRRLLVEQVSAVPALRAGLAALRADPGLDLVRVLVPDPDPGTPTIRALGATAVGLRFRFEGEAYGARRVRRPGP